MEQELPQVSTILMPGVSCETGAVLSKYRSVSLVISVWCFSIVGYLVNRRDLNALGFGEPVVIQVKVRDG